MTTINRNFAYDQVRLHNQQNGVGVEYTGKGECIPYGYECVVM